MKGSTTTVYDYTLYGKLITHLTKTVNGTKSDEMHFFYAAANRPAKVEFNSTVYTYLHNLQGDIVGIIDGAGTLVVEYKYDAWGNIIGANPETGIATIKPFRYRGYLYDVQTELYCLQFRYYSSNDGRFISIDNVIGSLGIVLSHSLYCYCNNNAIMFVDHLGQKGKAFLLGNATESCYNIELTVYVPKQEVEGYYPKLYRQIFGTRIMKARLDQRSLQNS